MGFTPEQINAMSIWQYMAYLDGYIEANSSSDTGATMAQDEQSVVAAAVLALS